MLKQFFDWWTQQMRDLLKQGTPTRRRALVLRLEDDDSITLARSARGQETALGRFTPDRESLAQARRAAGPTASIILRLPPGRLLERSITLPLAAEADLGRVLGYEMDRVTPFSAAELVWTHRLERRDRAQGKLHLRLAMVLRAGLDPVLDTLRQAGLAPTLLEAPDSQGTPQFLTLSNNARDRTATTRIAAWACAALALAVIAAPVALNELAIARADARIEALRPQLAEAETLRARLAASTGIAQGLAAEAARIGDPLRTLAALTGILPDDTWLSALTLQQHNLTFTGQSAHAAQLITLLSSSPAFKEPAFASPVTRADANGADLFSIRAKAGL